MTDQEKAIQAEITRWLTRLADPQRIVGVPSLSIPYLRRHLVEHAAAAGMLDEVLTAALLPFLDADRLRAVLSSRTHRAGHNLLIRAWSRVAHRWNFDWPAMN